MLPNDIARCAGTSADICETCARRQQIDLDEGRDFSMFLYMGAAEKGGKCDYFMEGGQ